MHRKGPEKVARTAAIATATAAVLCGICCVLPFALPAVAAAMSGGVLAWIGRGHTWATRIATVVVIATWAWIAWTNVRTKKRAARSTIIAMIIATAVLVLAIIWPRIEPAMIRRLRAPVATTPALPRSVTTAQAVVELIATPAESATGERWLGVRFRLAKGWHIYWQNPGDSGSAPTVQWTVTGATVDAFEWPTPHRLPVGPLMNYGYEGDVTLPARLQTANGTMAPAVIEAMLRWVVCAEVCVPGKANLAIRLGDTDNAALKDEWIEDIEKARSRVPTPMPAGWSATATSQSGFFVVAITADGTLAEPFFFPIDESRIDDSAPQSVSIIGRQVRFRLKKSAQLVQEPTDLRGVLTLGSNRGVLIDAPVTATRQR